MGYKKVRAARRDEGLGTFLARRKTYKRCCFESVDIYLKQLLEEKGVVIVLSVRSWRKESARSYRATLAGAAA